MTKKSRYFLVAAGAVLILGVGGGLIAYLAYQRASGVPAGVPAEVRYVPANAALVGYANVRTVMNSELRRELMPTIEMESRKGPHMMNDFAGIDFEKQVDHFVGYVEGAAADARQDTDADRAKPPRALMLLQGGFEQARIEQYIRDHGGTIEDYRGHHMSVRPAGPEALGVGFVRPDLIAVGQADLVRRAIDADETSSGDAQNLTKNTELMDLIRDASGSTAWVVGYFDTVSRGMRLPTHLRGQVPPLRLVAAKADVNGGVKATIRAEAADAAAAEQLREVVRAFVSLARLNAGARPEFDNTLKSLQLSGTDKTVRLTVAVSPETVRALAPRPRQ
jgi:hypothetical protein